MSYPAFFAALLALGLPLCAGAAQAQVAAGRIGFLRVAVTDSSVALLEAVERPGRLKQPRGLASHAAFSYEVRGGDGALLWHGALEDPLAVRQEYVDADGQLRSRLVQREAAEVFVRIPVAAPYQTVAFYRQAGGAGKSSDRRLLGTLDVTF